MENQRFQQLDSLRGLAAFSVLLYHMYLVAPAFPSLLWYSPLRVTINGHGAVILFFVLSGFVLSLPFFTGKVFSYKTFIIKRIFRLYIPYLVAIVFSILFFSFFSKGGIDSLSPWFNLFWTEKADTELIVSHVNLLGNLYTDAFNTVIWTLIHEMRISIVFPVIMYFIIKYSNKTNFVICFLLSAISGLNEIYHFEVSNGFHTTLFDTLHYAAIFMLGALTAKNIPNLTKIYMRMKRSTKVLLLLFGLMAYAYAMAIYFFTLLPFTEKIGDYGVAIGAIIIILLSLTSYKVKKVLINKSFVFLGKISYSLYLFHFPVLFVMIYLLHGSLPIWLIYIITLPTVMIISTIAWYFVERPCIKIGRTFSTHLNKGKPTASGHEVIKYNAS